MIYTDMVTINGRKFIRTYSDTYMVTRDGVEYDEAVDPLDSGRLYTETDEPIDVGTREETVEDYKAALQILGVETEDSV